MLVGRIAFETVLASASFPCGIQCPTANLNSAALKALISESFYAVEWMRMLGGQRQVEYAGRDEVIGDDEQGHIYRMCISCYAAVWDMSFQVVAAMFDKLDNPGYCEKMEQWGTRSYLVKVCTCTVSYTCSASTGGNPYCMVPYSLTEKAACINDDETYEVINYTTTVRNLVKTENEECRM
ncbi:hypothetical protein Tco_1493965 [Tanacetum coccineum]